MSLALASRLDFLRDRALMLDRARKFFADRNVCEVDVPILGKYPSIDPNIELVQATCLGERMFLHSSPEYKMKYLLSEGSGDIYQMSHVFRDEERGERHRPEFTMVEWYRCGFSLEEMMQETADFVSLFFDETILFDKINYRDAFVKYAGRYPEDKEERDNIFVTEIEPELQHAIIYGFPEEQAILSKVKNGSAQRFEIFYEGVELANGYEELTDHDEHIKRFDKVNEERILQRREKYQMDVIFLESLQKGLPECCGVAVGFDRLMMLRHNLRSIYESSFFI